MQRHLLVTVSEDVSAMFGVRFFCSFFRNRRMAACTLLYIAPDPAQGLSQLDIHQDIAAFERRVEAAREKGEGALAKARDYILEHDFPPENIRVKLLTCRQGTAQDIIREGVDGNYDAVVLGRRGITRLEELVNESMSKTLLTTRLNVPIWTCHHPERDRRHVLLAVDGSEASLRAADHAGFMLAEEPEHKVTIFHVRRPGEGLDQAEAVAEQARAVLLESGLPPERIAVEIVREAGNLAGLIKDEAEMKAYAAVAMGRTGADKSPVRRLFMGSVTFSLLHSMTKAALWVSH